MSGSERRSVDLATVAELRRGHAEAVALSARGRLAEALSCEDPARSGTYVVKVLDVAPGLGKVAGRRLLDSLGVPQFATLGDLDDAARRAILRASTGGRDEPTDGAES